MSYDLKTYSNELFRVRAEIISLNKAIESIEVFPSPWSFGNGGDLYSKLTVWNAVKATAEEEYEKYGACLNPNPRIKQAIAFLNRNPEFQLDTVIAKNFDPAGKETTLPPSTVEYWPDLKKQLSAQMGSGWDVSGMLCAACHETLLFEGTIGPDGRPRPHVEREPCMEGNLAIVLPCGHIFCKPCLNVMRQAWVDADEADEFPNDLCCPFCQMKLQYECGHFYEDLPAPETPEDFEAFPLTVPEGASPPPPRCDHCIWNKVRGGWRTSSNWALNATYADCLFLLQAREAGDMMCCFSPSGRQLARLRRLQNLADMVGPDLVLDGVAAEDTHPSWCVESELASYATS
jgi:hypothetical protein